jgi:xanthine dehydrogenase accessory factor
MEAVRASSADRAAARVVVTALPPGSPEPAAGSSQQGPAAPMGVPLVVHADGRLDGSLGEAEADAALVEAASGRLASGTSGTLELGGAQLFLEAFPAWPRLVVIGAVPVAAAVARIAGELGYETIVVDARPAFARAERVPGARLVVAWPDEAAEAIELGPADAVAVLSHDPKFDDPAVVAALERGCRYVGVLGSRKTQAARRQRLLELGVTAEQLERLHAPIGLDLGGRTPAETALAILAEITAERSGAGAGQLREQLPASPA